MKKKYTMPLISIVELSAVDVLSFSQVNPNRFDNAALSGKEDAQNSIFSLENIL